MPIHSMKKDAPWSAMLQLTDLSDSKILVLQHNVQRESGPHPNNLSHTTQNPSTITKANVELYPRPRPSLPTQTRSWIISIHVLALSCPESKQTLLSQLADADYNSAGRAPVHLSQSISPSTSTSGGGAQRGRRRPRLCMTPWPQARISMQCLPRAAGAVARQRPQVCIAKYFLYLPTRD